MAKVVNFDKTEAKTYKFESEQLHEVLGITEQELEQLVGKVMREFSQMYEGTEATGHVNVKAAFDMFTDSNRSFEERFALFTAIMLQLNEAIEIKNACNVIFALTSKPMVDRQLYAVFNEVHNMKSSIQKAIEEQNKPTIIKP